MGVCVKWVCLLRLTTLPIGVCLVWMTRYFPEVFSRGPRFLPGVDSIGGYDGYDAISGRHDTVHTT